MFPFPLYSYGYGEYGGRCYAPAFVLDENQDVVMYKTGRSSGWFYGTYVNKAGMSEITGPKSVETINKFLTLADSTSLRILGISVENGKLKIRYRLNRDTLQDMNIGEMLDYTNADTTATNIKAALDNIFSRLAAHSI